MFGGKEERGCCPLSRYAPTDTASLPRPSSVSSIKDVGVGVCACCVYVCYYKQHRLLI